MYIYITAQIYRHFTRSVP